MTSTVDFSNNVKPNNISDADSVSLRSPIRAALQKVQITATKPMFVSASMLPAIAASLKQVDVEKTKKTDKDLPNTIPPCWQFMAKLQNVHSNLNGLKAKGMLMGEDANTKKIGYARLPEGIDIAFKSH